MAREFFCAYHSYLDAIEPLDDAERGRLFTACLTYSKTGESPPLTGNERFVFPSLKGQIDRDRASYEEKCQRMRTIGEKGLVSQGKCKQKDAYASKEKEKEKPVSLSPSLSSFESFWSLYPRKANREAALKAWESISPDEALTQQILTAVKRQKQSDQWTDDGGKFIPYPAKWLTERRWEDEPEQAARHSKSYDIDELEKMSFFDVPEDL